MTNKCKKLPVKMEQKLQALFFIDTGESQTKIAQELGVGKKVFLTGRSKYLIINCGLTMYKHIF